MIIKKTFTNNEIENFKNLSEYDKFCYILLKNYPNNLYIKIPKTEYYINYFNKNINYVYELNSFIDIKSKKRIYTNFINKDLLNSVLFAYNINTTNKLENIMWINISVINLLEQNYFKYKTKTVVKTLDIDILKDIYEDEHINILKKIDKIKENVK